MSTQLAVLEPQVKRDSPAESLARSIMSRLDSVAAKLRDLEADIRKLWIEFDNLKDGETILGCRTKKEFCEKKLHRTPRAIQYLLYGRTEPVLMPSEQCSLPPVTYTDDKKTGPVSEIPDDPLSLTTAELEEMGVRLEFEGKIAWPKGIKTIGQTPATCGICNESFPSRTKWKKHLHLEHGISDGVLRVADINLANSAEELRKPHPDLYNKVIAGQMTLKSARSITGTNSLQQSDRPRSELSSPVELPKTDKLKETKIWLQAYLADGPKKPPFKWDGHLAPLETISTDQQKGHEKAGWPPVGMKTKTMRTAINELGITLIKDGPKGGARWHLPSSETPQENAPFLTDANTLKVGDVVFGVKDGVPTLFTVTENVQGAKTFKCEYERCRLVDTERFKKTNLDFLIRIATPEDKRVVAQLDSLIEYTRTLCDKAYAQRQGSK